MLRVFKKEQILTIPNFLSLLRLLMIPVIVWLYCFKKSYYWALFVIILSGITDISDGIIARKFNMVSDFGKAFDPLADKLTQFALFICLFTKYKLMLLIICTFFVKQITMFVMGYISLKKKDSVNSAKWYGKVNTVFLYCVLGSLVVFPSMPLSLANGLIIAACAVDVITLFPYVNFYFKLLKK